MNRRSAARPQMCRALISHGQEWPSLLSEAMMHLSTERILTTHAGSLPRPASLLPLVYAQEAGEPVEAARFEAEVRSAVQETVQKQVDAGVDVINDGEVSKPSYATYVKDRLSGFGGVGSLEEVASSVMGLDDFPDYVEQLAATMAMGAKIKFTSCDAPVEFVGQDAVRADIAHMKAALSGVAPAETFMSSASPGVISVFSPNRYYPSEEDYLGAIADAMRQEYEAIYEAGFVLQLDCPDLAMTAPGAGSLENFRTQMERNVEALNHAVADIPAEAMRIHICWGNGEMPRTTDVELKDIIDIVLKAKPAGIMLMASNGRHEHEWQVFEDVKLPAGKYLIPGVLDSTSNVVEHPEVVAQRLVRYAEVVGRENVMAGTDCGFGTIAGMQLVVPTVTWAKFRAMTEGAKLASERLWS
jgi:5-methyltetrahydropteroyltriglutamate--homocysteine methyltransferase